MSRQERFLAWSSEKLLYALMFALPLVGWGMLSAGHYPIVMFGLVLEISHFSGRANGVAGSSQDPHSVSEVILI